MTYSLTWLPDVLRGAGLKVAEVPGWQSRGRAEMGPVKGVLCHHTAGPASAQGTPSLSLIVRGRPDLPGPLSQLYLARDGTVHVVGAGRCNHAGAGSWRGVTAGNSSFVGIEAENAGTGNDPWPDGQMDAYARTVAAILKHIGAGSEMCAGHKEYALPRGRKVDPSFDMAAFRENVGRHMGTGGPSAPGPAEHPRQAMLRRGSRGEDVALLQGKLGIAADGIFGGATETAVKAFQASHNLTRDGVVGPATWAALG